MNKELSIDEFTLIIKHLNNKEDRFFEDKKQLFNSVKEKSSKLKIIPIKKNYYIILTGENKLLPIPMSKETIDFLIGLDNVNKEKLFSLFKYDLNSQFPPFIYIQLE